MLCSSFFHFLHFLHFAFVLLSWLRMPDLSSSPPHAHRRVVPQLQHAMQTNPCFQDPEAPPCTTPVTAYGKRLHYTVKEYDPLLDSCNMGHKDWAKMATCVEAPMRLATARSQRNVACVSMPAGTFSTSTTSMTRFSFCMARTPWLSRRLCCPSCCRTSTKRSW